jgi:hypothetical protein
MPLAWSRDGQSLFVREAGGLKFRRIVRFDLKTRSRSLWKELRIPDPSGAAIVYQPLIACDGECYFYTVLRQPGNLYVVEGLK